MNPNVIKSYLVSLGFSADMGQFAKFQASLKDAGSLVGNFTGGAIKGFAKFESAVVSAYAAIGTATLAMMDKVAQADMGYQVLATRMFMSADAAKKMKIATDALGYSIEDIAWNPELRGQYDSLIKLQDRLQEQLGPDFSQRMKEIRLINKEFLNMKIEGQYFFMGLSSSLMKTLGGDGTLKSLKDFNEWIVKNIPYWSNLIAKDLSPVLRDAVLIGKDVGSMLKDLTSVSLQFLGVFYQDEALKSGIVNLENIGKAAKHVSETLVKVQHVLAAVVHLIAEIASPVIKVLDAIDNSSIGKTMVGAGRWLDQRLGTDFKQSPAVSPTQGVTSNQAKLAAQRAASQLGIPAEIIYGQWAHETGNFTNRGSAQLNNLAGIRIPGSTEYRSFSSIQEFTDYYTKLLSSNRYSGVRGSVTPEQFAWGLKSGGYYEDSYANYSAGIKRWQPSYQPSSNAVTIGELNTTVQVINPNASADEIAQKTSTAIRNELGSGVKKNLAAFSPVYG